MTISKTQTEYAQDLIAMGVTETDAQEAAHILRQIDKERLRTPLEQALIKKVYQQIQESLVKRGLAIPKRTS